jgi:hypothetical protein
MFKDIPASDVITRAIKVFKEWRLDENDILPIYAISGSSGNFDDTYDPKSNGYSQKSLYASIKSQFYRNPETGSVLDGGRRKSYTSKDERNIEATIAVLAVPQKYYGEGIKPGTLTLIDESTGVTYRDDGYSNLEDSNFNIKGNVFYELGIIVITKDVIQNTTLTNFFLDYRSTKTIYENEIFVSVLENEFNFSQNPSAVYQDGGYKSQVLINDPWDPTGKKFVSSSIWNWGTRYVRNKNFPYSSSLDTTKKASFDDYAIFANTDRTGSYLAPYITTIGLYDDALNMVAVAKLPVPIKSLPDYPVNFIVRFDT